MKTMAALILSGMLAFNLHAQSLTTPSQTIQPNNPVIFVAAGVIVLVAGTVAYIEVHYFLSQRSLPNTYCLWPNELYTYGSTCNYLNGYWEKRADCNSTGGGYYVNRMNGFGMWLALTGPNAQPPYPHTYSWVITEAPRAGHTVFAQCGPINVNDDNTNNQVLPPTQWHPPYGPVGENPSIIYDFPPGTFTNAYPPIARMPTVSINQSASVGSGTSVVSPNHSELLNDDEFAYHLRMRFGLFCVGNLTNVNPDPYTNYISIAVNVQTLTGTNGCKAIWKDTNGVINIAGDAQDTNTYAAWFQLPFTAQAGYMALSDETPAPAQSIFALLGSGSGTIQKSHDLLQWTNLVPASINASNVSLMVLDEDAPPDKCFYRLAP